MKLTIQGYDVEITDVYTGWQTAKGPERLERYVISLNGRVWADRTLKRGYLTPASMARYIIRHEIEGRVSA